MRETIHSRRCFLKAAGLGVASLALPARGVVQSPSTRKPNLVFILVDDMGWTDAGCYGSSFYETPNIDRLAAQGVRFTDAYAACPVCSPTRASIMSGKYPARIGLTNWLCGSTHKKLRGADYVRQLPLEEVTIAETLKEAGYATAAIGKWHLGTEPYFPEHQGFDINVAGAENGSPRSGYFSPYKLNNLADGPEGEYLTDRLTDEAVKFIEAHQDTPFFLYLSHYAVHTPIQAKQEYTEKYKGKAAVLSPTEGPRFLPEGEREARQVQDHPVYAAMVQSMDESVGGLMDKLEELGIADNTVVFFMSDNGGLSTSEGSPTSNVPLRAGKGWLYEGGIREPMIIKWPGVARPGGLCREPVISTDFYPTLLEIAGLPRCPDQHKDGVSLVPLLRGARQLGRRALYWHYPHYSPQGGAPSSAVRMGDYKLIEFYENNHIELYDLKKDIGEKHDLAAEMPKKAKDLLSMLHGWCAEVNAQMPTPNPEWRGGS